MDNLQQANELGEEELRQNPKVIGLKFNRKTKRLVFDLSNEITFLVPANLIQGLQNATKKDLETVEFWDEGLMIYWSNLDVAFQVSSLMKGVFGSKYWMSEIAKDFGRKGGLVKSDLKTQSSRENGKKGGRPKKIAA
jgi:Protein of unknown function (DUF2442)